MIDWHKDSNRKLGWFNGACSQCGGYGDGFQM